jgi:hypothetical protein
LQKATKLGVKIISEQEFVDMIGGEDHPVVEPTKEPEQQSTAPVQGSLF